MHSTNDFYLGATDKAYSALIIRRQCAILVQWASEPSTLFAMTYIAASSFGMDINAAKDEDLVSLGDEFSETNYNDEVDQARPLAMDTKPPKVDDSDSLSETTYNDEADEVDQSRPLTIKKRLASLDGAFPMDEAVVEGMPPA